MTQPHSEPESEGRGNWVLGKPDGPRCMERESSDLTPCGVSCDSLPARLVVR